MSDSALVCYRNISANRTSPRERKIDGIAIHCFVGQVTTKRGVDYLQPASVQASANYVIGTDGSVGLSVPEADRAWTTSSRATDARCVTIECASDASHPYAVNSAVYATLLQLCADICRRNGIARLVWSTSKDDRTSWRNGCNLQVHRDYYPAKSCPGDYLYNRMGAIAEGVNALLAGGAAAAAPATTSADDTCAVSVRVLGRGDEGDDVQALQAILNAKGYSCGSPDGDFGPKTEAALIRYQRAAGLTADGIAGGCSWAKLLAK